MALPKTHDRADERGDGPEHKKGLTHSWLVRLERRFEDGPIETENAEDGELDHDAGK